MPIQFTILPGLPPYGPAALPFPPNGRRAFSEGIVIQFETVDGTSWIGNFQRDNFKFDKVLPHPNGLHVIVIAGGAVYTVDAQTRNTTVNSYYGITYAEPLPDLGAILLGNGIEFIALRIDGEWWKSPRISWDGMRNIIIKGNELIAEAYSPASDKWYPFKLDLLTGTCKDSIYETEMATAIRVVKS